MGLARAGFEVTGVDIKSRPSYPFRFVQADALTFDLRGFDLVWASPPCQRYAQITKRHGRQAEHPDLIAPMRDRLRASGIPFILENVGGAPLQSPSVLCGSMFGLRVRRHRLFETSFPVLAPTCNHEAQGRPVGVYGHSGGSSKRDGLTFGGAAEWRAAMGIDWMTRDELAQAIPPAYSEFLARAFLRTKEAA